MSEFDLEIDSSGMNCPLPVLKARKALNTMEVGKRLRLIATDPGSLKDIAAFCKMTGNPLIENTQSDEKLYFIIEKGN